MSGSSSNFLFDFRFGQTWSETKTLQIVLESFCVHSSAHASFYFPYRGSSCFPSVFLPLWSPTFPPRALALISFFLAKVRFSLTLTLFFLMIWCSGPMVLFLFVLAKAALAYLPTAHFVVLLRLRFPYQQAQYAQVSLLKPAPLYKLFAGLGSTYKSATSLLLSSYLFCSPLHVSFYFNLSGRSDRSLWQICLHFPSVLSGHNGFPDTGFSRRTTRLMSWPNGERYSCPLQSLVVSLLLSLVSSLI